MSKKKRKDRKKLICSFCGKASADVEKMVTGPRDVHICCECVEQVHEVGDASTGPKPTCSFCSKSVAQVEGLFSTPSSDAYMCTGCLKIVQEILAEDAKQKAPKQEILAEDAKQEAPKQEIPTEDAKQKAPKDEHPRTSVRKRLFTPGPTPVPERIALAMAHPITHHRAPEFEELFAEVNEGLKYLFRTENDVFTLTASGTGALEAAVVNTLSAGDRVLVVRGGKFGERWAELCEAYGVEVVSLDVPWGDAVDPEEVARAFYNDPEIKAVLATQSETSTGVLHDIEAIHEQMRDYPALLIVDAVSGMTANPLEFDRWKLDVLVTGSQKGLMLPPGLAFICLSDRAWIMSERSNLPKYYWDLAKARASLAKRQTPYTPAVSLLVGLREALTMIREEGLENVWSRHARHAGAVRTAVSALGLTLFAQAPSNVLTIAEVPEGIDGKALVSRFRSEYGVTITGGQDHLSGKVFRISHLGYVDDFDLLAAISALERVLADLGWSFDPGTGVAALQRALME